MFEKKFALSLLLNKEEMYTTAALTDFRIFEMKGTDTTASRMLEMKGTAGIVNNWARSRIRPLPPPTIDAELMQQYSPHNK